MNCTLERMPGVTPKMRQYYKEDTLCRKGHCELARRRYTKEFREWAVQCLRGAKTSWHSLKNCTSLVDSSIGATNGIPRYPAWKRRAKRALLDTSQTGEPFEARFGEKTLEMARNWTCAWRTQDGFERSNSLASSSSEHEPKAIGKLVPPWTLA